MKRVALVALSTVLLFAGCGGSTPNTNTNEDLNANAVLSASDSLFSLDANGNVNGMPVNVNGNSNVNGDSLIGGAMGERKQLEDKLKSAKATLEEANKMDYSTQKSEIEAKIATVKATTEELKKNDDFFVDADGVQQEADALSVRLANFVQVPELAQIVDLTAKFEKANIKGLTRRGDSLYAVGEDAVYGPLDTGKFDDVKEIKLPTGNVGASGTYSLKYKEMFIDTIPGQLWKLKDNTMVAQKVADGGVWYPSKNLEAYGKSVYILDPLSKKFLRYDLRSDNLFEKAVVALDHPDLQNGHIQSFTVDGNIYVLKEGGVMMRFISGQKKDMEIDKDLSFLSSEAMITSSVNSSNLYIFDPTKKRLLKMKKLATGLSVSKEYTLPREYNGILIHSNEKRAYLFDQKRVYALDL